jgi:hypothetical protein
MQKTSKKQAGANREHQREGKLGSRPAFRADENCSGPPLRCVGSPSEFRHPILRGTEPGQHADEQRRQHCQENRESEHAIIKAIDSARGSVSMPNDGGARIDEVGKKQTQRAAQDESCLCRTTPKKR